MKERVRFPLPLVVEKMSEMKVEKKGRKVFRVSSEHQDGVAYGVKYVKADVWTCTCPHFIHSDVEKCKHILRVQEVLDTGDYEDSDERKDLIRELLETYNKLGDLYDRFQILEGNDWVLRR